MEFRPLTDDLGLAPNTTSMHKNNNATNNVQQVKNASPSPSPLSGSDDSSTPFAPAPKQHLIGSGDDDDDRCFAFVPPQPRSATMSGGLDASGSPGTSGGADSVRKHSAVTLIAPTGDQHHQHQHQQHHGFAASMPPPPPPYIVAQAPPPQHGGEQQQQGQMQQQQDYNHPSGLFQPLTNLYVSNLSVGVDNDLLFSWFRAYGPLVSACVMVDVHTGRSRGYGFVQFESETDGEAALKGLNGTSMFVPRDNQTIVVRVQRSMFHKGVPAAPSNSIFLRNIPNTYDSSRLLPILSQYGEVERIQLFSIFENPRLLKACVDFKTMQGALNAVNALHRKLLDPTCEVALACRFADQDRRLSSSSATTTMSGGSGPSSRRSSAFASGSTTSYPADSRRSSVATPAQLNGAGEHHYQHHHQQMQQQPQPQQQQQFFYPQQQHMMPPPPPAGAVQFAPPGAMPFYGGGAQTQQVFSMPQQHMGQQQGQPQQQQQQYVLVHIPGHNGPVALPLGPNGTVSLPPGFTLGGAPAQQQQQQQQQAPQQQQ